MRLFSPRRILNIAILSLFATAAALPCGAAKIKAKGFVCDSITGEAVAKASIRSYDGRSGTSADRRGAFTITLPDTTSFIRVSALGYGEKLMDIRRNNSTNLKIALPPHDTELAEVVVRPKKQKYSKKNNPAVDLMQRLRKAAHGHDPLSLPYYAYDKYEKTVIGLNNYTGGADSTKKPGKMTRLFMDCVDTALWTGKRILTLSIKEKYSTRITSSKPKADKEIVIAGRSAGVDESLNQANVKAALEDVLREIDVYQNDIALLQNRFVSPLSKIGADFYKYFITDTLLVDGQKCTELTFLPRNPATFGFNGKLFVVENDSSCYVKRLTMRVPKAINLNYISNIFVNQNFRIDSLGKVVKTLDDISLEIEPIKGLPQFYARRETHYDNFSYARQEKFADFYDRLGNIFEIDETPEMTAAWPEMRMVPLSRAEIAVGNLMGKARKNKFLYWTEKVVEIFAKGYIGAGRNSKFDIGPVNTMVSYNSMEGLRLRFGGMTTANLSKHFFVRGYGAYGFHDNRWKYRGELEYSFTPKKYHSREFPVHSLRLTHSYDLDMIGQHYLFTNSDNVFLSLKRKESNLDTYRRYSELLYTLELRNNFSLTAAICNQRQEATRWLPFVNGRGEAVTHFDNTWFRVALRYAPGEKFVQGATVRMPINMDAPVFQLSHEFGPSGWFGSSFCINTTELSVSKRFWLSAFGYIDLMVKGGIIWSKVQYPALLWPNANLSYTIQPESYSLMNPMEFANDRYASIDFTYWANGALFNRIPFFNKLKLREILTFKTLWGGLSRRNDPQYNDELYRFPVDAVAMKMDRKPYMEIGVGIDNILTILRVDYVWRLTYRDTPGVDHSGVRVSLHFSF